jgi:hypothetical protein
MCALGERIHTRLWVQPQLHTQVQERRAKGGLPPAAGYGLVAALSNLKGPSACGWRMMHVLGPGDRGRGWRGCEAGRHGSKGAGSSV